MRILVAGASGYIGQRLVPALLDAGHQVICLVRDPRRPNSLRAPHPGLTVIRGDLLDPTSLDRVPADIEAAYYLVHSMSGVGGDFRAKEAACARHFIAALAGSNCRHIVYLSGIANDNELSHHLSSRVAVETILQEGPIPVTVLRAAIIIGSGSASFEIIRDLVEKLPVMITPRWLNTRCQPIAVRDVIYYLTHVLRKPAAYGQVWDIGGPDVLTYREMLLGYAHQRKLWRLIQTVPVLTPRLSAYWLYFITATSYPLARSLVDSMKNEVVVRRKGIEQVIPYRTTDYATALARALQMIQNNQVLSSWKDSVVSGHVREDYLDFLHIPSNGVCRNVHELPITRTPSETRALIYGIGGRRGWYHMDWAWSLRGSLDKLAGGVGLRRGRRNQESLRVGDALDFWRVLLTDQQKNRLALFAEMKLPGEAWLEFELVPGTDGLNLRLTTSFRPRGLAGRLYWYGILPLHHLVFRGLARYLAQGRKRSPKPIKTREQEETASRGCV